MAVVEAVLARIPARYRAVAVRHKEIIKFAVVGGTTFVIDNGIWYGLKLTILAPKPVMAKVIAVLIATIVSYVLNREWSFRTRGGRERHHEATLFFVISGIAMALNIAPLWISRYVFQLQQPYVSLVVQEISDFASGSIIGMLLAMVFRFWSFRKWVFPQANARPRVRISSVNGTGPLITSVNGTNGSATSVNGSGPAEEEVGHV